MKLLVWLASLSVSRSDDDENPESTIDADIDVGAAAGGSATDGMQSDSQSLYRSPDSGILGRCVGTVW